MSSWKNVQYKDGRWQTASGGGGGASTLDGLDDVNLTTPSDGQVLQYDNANSKWVNATPSSGSRHNYSTTEQVVGTWINGKPLYEKVFTGSLTATASYDNICDKTDYDMEDIVGFDGYWGNTSVGTGYFAQLGCFIESGFYGGIYIGGSTVQLYHPRNLNYYAVVLRYTKTTDT